MLTDRRASQTNDISLQTEMARTKNVEENHAAASIDLSNLQTEGRNPLSTNIDLLPTLDLVRVINQEDHGVAPAVAKALPAIAAAIDALAPRVAAGGRVVYIGAGTSGR